MCPFWTRFEFYREGIDTLEEYKENKMILQKERNSLENILIS